MHRLPISRPLLALGAGLFLVSPILEATPTETASYRVGFQASWTAQSHPIDFPSNPHFSGLIGGVHDDRVTFWSEDGLASPGIEAMAEVGAKSPLDTEVEQAITDGTAAEVISGGGIAESPGSAQAFFTVTRDHPLATVVSMIAPSPDWFVGVSGLDLFQNGDWIRETVVNLYAWDAGTDSGPSFTSNDADTSPQEPISRLTSGPASGAPFGTFVFTRIDPPLSDPLELRTGRFLLRSEWGDAAGTRGVGHPVPLTDETGWFWFFSPGNLELVVKVLDGCGINGHYWVFAAGLTNVEVDLEITDTDAMITRTWQNPLGTDFEPVLDIEAFATCP